MGDMVIIQATVTGISPDVVGQATCPVCGTVNYVWLEREAPDPVERKGCMHLVRVEYNFQTKEAKFGFRG